MRRRAIGIGALAQSLALTPASHAGFGHGLAMRTFFALVASVVLAGTSGAAHCPDGSVGSPRPNMSCNAYTPCCPGLVCMKGNVPSVKGSCKVGTSTTTGFRHVLLISIDGMHALDFSNCATGL